MTETRSLLATEARRDELRVLSADWPSCTLDGARLADFEALVGGFLWPLHGYGHSLGQYGACGSLAPLDVPATLGREAKPGSRVALRDPEGVLLGVLDVESQREDEGRWRLSGRVEGVELPAHDDFAASRLSPGGLSRRAKAGGHRAVLAFVPRDLLHAATRAALVAAAEHLDAAILVLIPSAVAGHHESGEFARVRALELSAGLLPPRRRTVAVAPLALPADARHAATRSALVARNCGASHCAVDETRMTPAELEALRSCATDLGIEFVPFRPWAYSRRTRGLVSAARANDDVELAPPAEQILSWPRSGVPDWLLTGAEIEALQRAYVPRHAQGFTVFLTGLSGSGKSTIARALRVRLMEMTGRPVTLLDGDRVRRHLSSELGFSREHRNLNILRIGWVASEITRHGGIAICAPIAPYEDIRRQVREMIEPAGGFLLVHVATPLETCEARDRKGLYARARAGLLPQFTGVSDPYEPPADAALAIDTRHTTVAEACRAIVERLIAEGYLGR